MLHKIWRYSHFTLTVSSFLFLLLASITGAFLAFKPIQEKLQPFKINGVQEVLLSDLIKTLSSKYEEVLDIEIDNNYFIKASVFSLDADMDGQFYIHPLDGTKIADIPKSIAFFDFLTNLHRSLFLKTPGRVLVGIASFLLCLIAITGLLLALKRQGGIIKLYSKIIKDEAKLQYNHVILGRFLLIPIFIVALTGTYLSLDKFSMLPKSKTNTVKPILSSTKTLSFWEFDVFKNTPLKDVQKLEFPFSTDEEDYFTLYLKNQELKIHQKTGEIVEQSYYSYTEILSVLSFNLHTGNGSIIWSLVLFISSLAILYFMYSGSIISYQRLRSKIKNKYTANQAEYIILVGSENGSTKRLGKVLQQALLDANQKVFLDELNNYKTYKNIEHLIVLTSTYGQGEAPSNANLFLEKLKQINIEKSFKCSVIGFGSYAYPQFCEFAKDIHKSIINIRNVEPVDTSALLIHNQNYQEFKNWGTAWGQSIHLNLVFPADVISKKVKSSTFKIVSKKVIQDAYSETFTLTLVPEKTQKFTSGDLLGVTPLEDNQERLYSMGQNAEGNILLSIKKHTQGICSTYLHQLQIDDKLKANIQENKSFHFPKKASSVILIANGTGIAPFLGMIHQKTKADVTLYFGTRTKKSSELYETSISEAVKNKTLHNYYLSLSKEEGRCKYVQDLLWRDEKEIASKLQDGGVFMLCGSLLMRDSVFETLENICTKHQLQPLRFYQNKQQILTDCY